MHTQLLPFHVGVRDGALEKSGERPGALFEQRHQGGDQGHANDERIQGNTDCKPERNGLDRIAPGGHERDEDKEHNQSGRGHYSCRRGVALLNGISPVPGVDMALSHTRDKKYLVVHREPEQHSHQDDRHKAQNRSRSVHSGKRTEPPPLEHSNHDTKSGGHGEYKPERSFDRDDK